MYKIGILPNITRDYKLEYTKDLLLWLTSNYTININAHIDLKKILGKTPCITYVKTTEDLCKDSDFVIILGGDGTILDKTAFCAKYDVPIFGINLGGVGYLTDVERNNAKSALSKILNKNYYIENRTAIETSLNNKKYIALNDICVLKKDQSKLIALDIYVNDDYIDTYRGDGIIISTPTGSTAYNLSAGGPIIKPNLDVIAITPICPHKIFFRPLIVSGDDIVQIKEQKDAILCVDGKNISHINTDINIYKSKKEIKIIKTNDHSFYEILRQKLS